METIESDPSERASLLKAIPIAGLASLVSTSIKMVLAIKSKDQGKIAKGLGEFAKFLFKLGSPKEEPLTEQMERLFREVITETWVALFKSNLESVITYMDTEYFPRSKPRDQMSEAELVRVYDKLDELYFLVLKLRNASAAEGFEQVGFPTYIAAQNTILMILDQKAIYDPETSDKYKTTAYEVAIPEIIKQGKAHCLTTISSIEEKRQEEVELDDRTIVFPGYVTTEYKIKDKFIDFKTGWDRKAELARSLYAGYCRQVAGHEYEAFQIRQEIESWESMLGIEAVPVAFAYEWVPLLPQNEVYSSKGAGGSNGIMKLYNIPSSEIPEGYYPVGSFACVKVLPDDAALLVLKENQSGALKAPQNMS